MLRGVGITKNFGGLVALSNLGFEIKEKAITGLIGPNGSGKTTLFNIISGFYKPEKGKIFFNEMEITSLKAYEISRLGIARTFQIVRPLKDLSVLDNVATGILYGGETRNLEEARSKAVELLKFTKLESKKEPLLLTFRIGNDLR